MEGTSSLIGVAIAIGANTLISAGLNVERLAHIKRAHPAGSEKKRDRSTPPNERTPLIVVDSSSTNKIPPPYSRSLSEPLEASPTPSVRVAVIAPSPPSQPRRTLSHASTRSRQSKSSSSPNRPRTDKGFIRSPLWLFGFLLINLGEAGNFLAYGFAPTSLVAPLGMTALIANVFLAPAIVGEPFRKKDLIGIGISLIGGATVVYSSKSSDKKITPPELVEALRKPLFLAYSITSIILISFLAWVSQTRYGDRFVLVDLTLCALAGAFCVLSTKSLSSFLNSLGIGMFKEIITYPLLLVLLSTAFLQVNFINKSLQRFESRIVIPTQYMTFAVSSIVGSAILYRDFEGMSGQSLLNFGFGCVVSATGVYLLTRDDSQPSKPSSPSAQPAPHSPDSSSTETPSSSSPSLPVSVLEIAPRPTSSSFSVSPTTRIILPNHSLPFPTTFKTTTGTGRNGEVRPANGRTRTASIGKYRIATGGYLLVGTSPGALNDSRQDDELGSEAEEEEEGDGGEEEERRGEERV
ncbi:uncharacterized protein JCM6883_004436 [Sporobolomyces salmoneus]|uniref:uncharacterized protein n=1 Tax=Sporobolomyces salmoneus TaxID=183962 RepID=UPI003175E907